VFRSSPWLLKCTPIMGQIFYIMHHQRKILITYKYYLIL
jgi:hypothetical protein